MYWGIGSCRILLLCTYQNLSEIKYGIVDVLPVTVSAEVDAKFVARWVLEFFPLYNDFCFHAGWTCAARCGTHCLTEGGSVARTRCACVRGLTPRLCERCSLGWRDLGVKCTLCDVWPSVLPCKAGCRSTVLEGACQLVHGFRIPNQGKWPIVLFLMRKFHAEICLQCWHSCACTVR